MAKAYIAYRTAAPTVIDGRLNKPPWQRVPWTDDFVDIEGDSRPRPRFRTRAKMCWDEDCLYIAADIQEPHVWATLKERDSVIFHDNDFEVFIDPDGDLCDYYELEINALNTVWDLRLPRTYRDGGSAVNEWDIAGLRTAVRIEGTLNDASDIDRGWSVEIAIPWRALAEFSSVPAPPRDGDQWRINFSRVEWRTIPRNDLLRPASLCSARHHSRKAGDESSLAETSAAYEKVPEVREDNWVWSPQGVIDMHRPERWGYVQFTTAPPDTPVRFNPDPLATAKWWLQRVHEAQRQHRPKHGRFTASIADLMAAEPPGLRLCSFEASAERYLIEVEFEGRRLRKDETGRLAVS